MSKFLPKHGCGTRRVQGDCTFPASLAFIVPHVFISVEFYSFASELRQNLYRRDRHWRHVCLRDFRPEWTGFVNMHLQWSRHSLVARNSTNKLYLVSGGVCPRSGPRVAKGKCPEADWHEQNIFMEVAPRYGCAASVTVHGCAAQAAHLLLARFCRARASTWPHARKGFDICPVSRSAAWATRSRMGLAQPHGHAPQAKPEERAASKARRTRRRVPYGHSQGHPQGHP